MGAAKDGETLIEAAITFNELEELLIERGAAPRDQPTQLERETLGRRRHVSTAGGMPRPVLEKERAVSNRFRRVRGLEEVAAIAEGIQRNGDDAQLGFVDLLLYERDSITR